MLIDTIVQGGGVTATGHRGGRGRRRMSAPWRPMTRIVAREGVEVTGALEIEAFIADLPEAEPADTGPTFAVATVAGRLRAAGGTALATQARLGPKAVVRLVAL